MNRGKIDLILGVAVVMLIMIGQIMVFSASSMYAKSVFGSLTYFFQKQLLWGILTIIVIILMSRFDYRKLNNEKATLLLIVFSLFLLILVLFIGRNVNGATRWFHFGFISFQPSEIAKISIIVYLAYKLAHKDIENMDFKSFLMPIYIIIGCILLLINIQPDLSTSLLIAAIAGGMLFVSRVKQSYLFYTSLSIIPLGLFIMARSSYQLTRIKDWLGSIMDPLLAGYQVKQSIIGIGRGGITGNGMGESKQKLFFLPDSHTDFIFSIIGEEFGFIGASLILVIFVVITIRGLRLVRNAPDGFGQFLALGITLNISLYAFINVAVVTNLVPATGLPMPFISYGGSNLLFLGVGVGLLLNISRFVRHGNPEYEFSDQRLKLNSAILEID